MKDLLLITHIADSDEVTPVILAKFVYQNFDYLLVNPIDTDKTLKENLDNYKEIHIVDLGITEKLAKVIDKNAKWKNKVKIFDHHKSNEGLNKYPFATVIDENQMQKESGTSIYYNYLKTISDNKYLYQESMVELVNQVRIIDTYDFKNKNDEKAHNIDYLFNSLGYDNYIDYFYNYLKENKEFKYGKNEQFLIKLELDRMNKYIDNCMKNLIMAEFEGYKIGIVYAEKYSSDIGIKILTKYPNLDFVAIVHITRGVTYIGKDKVDLSEFARKYGGGGHKNASGSPLEKNLLNDITKLIFSNIKIKEEK